MPVAFAPKGIQLQAHEAIGALRVRNVCVNDVHGAILAVNGSKNRQ